MFSSAGGGGGWRRPGPFEFQWYFQYDTAKIDQYFRGYSLIHINKMIDLESMRLVYSHWAISLQ